ncbi:hypothetical protein J5N97_024050 [Dioscorea zingiberensis]|uniref:Uncharacterized protein n=1 Tax=Dioscorea zingiberensis TaxID=325984 RepID=A0A9D5C6B9_9LILI|nr:hypothetical protein J5N97_024050 [Dioscorea zingiberensis]
MVLTNTSTKEREQLLSGAIPGQRRSDSQSAVADGGETARQTATMSRVWRRETSPVPATVGIQAPPRHHRGTTTAHNSPRREGVSYAEATGGAGGQHSFIMEALATMRSPPHLSSEDDERGWEDVHFKRKRRDDERREPPPLGLGTRQGSPPTSGHPPV